MDMHTVNYLILCVCVCSYEVNSPRANFFHGFNGTHDPEDDYQTTDTSVAGAGGSKRGRSQSNKK